MSKKEKSSEVSINTEYLKKAWGFLQKPTVVAVIFILIALILSTHFRMYPASLPQADTWAADGIRNQQVNIIINQLQAQFPNAPADSLRAQANEQYQQLYEQQKAEIDAAIKQNGQSLRERFQDEDGQTYLLAIDPYYFYRLSGAYLENGHTGEYIKDGVPMTKLGLAPTERKAQRVNFHIWFQAMMYKIVSTFNSSVSLMTVAFYSPIILVGVAVILAFFLGKILAGNIGGFLFAALLGLHGSLLTRTAGGFSDTDAYAVLFPILIFLLIAVAVKQRKFTWLYASLAGLFMGLFGWAWSGWWFIFDFLIISFIGYAMYVGIIKFSNKDYKIIPDLKMIGIVLGCLVVFSAISVTFYLSLNSFISAPLQPIGFTTIKNAANADLWPNVYTTVAELNAGNLRQIISQMGGPFLLALALIGISTLLWTGRKNTYAKYIYPIGCILWYLILLLYTARNGMASFIVDGDFVFAFLLAFPIGVGLLLRIILKEKPQIEDMYAVLLVIWMVGTFYASTKGIRFTLLMVPPLALGVGVLTGRLHTLVSEWVSEYLAIPKIASSIVLFIIACSLLVAPIQAADQIGRNEVPAMNDAWYQTLIDIRDESQEDAIISSWWDFGHQFIAIAERGATADGGLQNTPQAHWLGKILSAQDQNVGLGVLRMLDCAGNGAYEEINGVIQDPVTSIQILDNMFGISKTEAQGVLESYNIPSANVTSILEKTHCVPPEAFVITSEDMVGKAGVWAHFGAWNFSRAQVWNDVRQESEAVALETIRTQLGLETYDAAQLYENLRSMNEDEGNTWIARWPNYYTQSSVACQQNEGVYFCPNGVIYDPETDNVSVSTQEGVFGMELSYIYKDGEGYYVEGSGDRPLGATVWERTLDNNQTQVRTILSFPELAGSTFTRLFFMDGLDSPYYEKFRDVRAVTGQRIITWKVDWESYIADLQ